jgi:hypothetical protein
LEECNNDLVPIQKHFTARKNSELKSSDVIFRAKLDKGVLLSIQFSSKLVLNFSIFDSWKETSLRVVMQILKKL